MPEAITSPVDATVAVLRRQIYGKDSVSRADFEQAASAGCGDTPEYASLLSDIAVDLLVNQADPPQYVTPGDADWLIGALGAHPLPYRVEMTLLNGALQYAVSLPPALSAFCLAEIERAVIEGRPDHQAGLVSADDVEYLRRSVYAADAGASLHVTGAEAETLFRIAHAARNPDPGFDTLFAEAVGNYLLGIAYRWTPSRDDALQLEKFENAPPPGIAGFFAAMLHPVAPTREDFESDEARFEAHEDADAAADAQERAEAERIDGGESAWLFAHLTRAGELTTAERALLAFLKQEAKSPPQALLDLCAQAGV